MEPIDTEEAIIAVATRLMQDLAPRLEADGKGARCLRLDLYRVDGIVQSLDLDLTAPTLSPDHIARLLHLQMERLTRPLEAGFGFETVSLAVTAAESMQPRQSTLAAAGDGESARRLSILLDALQQRLGPGTVSVLEPVASHWPERSERRVAAEGKATDRRGIPPWLPSRTARPPLLFPRAEPADVIALLPDGPPQRLRWRGKFYTVAHAEGPERIAGEWWRTHQPLPTRDYYVVEDGAGHRLWLYREGLPGRETAAPRWFVHGLFA
jgi:protein ImuB